MSRIRTAKYVIAIAFGAILLSAFPAVASATYLDWSVVATMPGNAGQTSPHGGYATSTIKCGVCHAVHYAAVATAGVNPQLLLQDSVANACIYCHVGGAGGYTQVYGGNPVNYTGTDFDNAHNEWKVAGVEQGVSCTSCHQVHAADGQMTANAYLTQMLLKGAKTYDAFNPNYDPNAGAPLSTDTSNTALTKWCAGCHFTRPMPGGSGSFYSTNYNDQTHVMTTATATYSNPQATYHGQVAWADSNYCASCHASGYTTAAWPHYTAGMKFLIESSGATATATGTLNPNNDGVCLRCHRQGLNGAGLTY